MTPHVHSIDPIAINLGPVAIHWYGVMYLLAFGLAWWSCIPRIERKTKRIRLLGICTVAGGLARLYSVMLAGAPSAGHLAGLAMELVVVPLILLWQARIARD